MGSGMGMGGGGGGGGLGGGAGGGAGMGGLGGMGGGMGFGGAQKCYQCGRPGHIARMCPAGGRPRGAFAAGFARPRVSNPDGTPVKC